MEVMNTVELFFVEVIGSEMIVELIWFVEGMGMNSVIGMIVEVIGMIVEVIGVSEMIVGLIWFVEGMGISFGVTGRIVCDIQVLLNAKSLQSCSLVHNVRLYYERRGENGYKMR